MLRPTPNTTAVECDLSLVSAVFWPAGRASCIEKLLCCVVSLYVRRLMSLG